MPVSQIFMSQMRPFIEDDVRTAIEGKLFRVIALESVRPRLLFTPAPTDMLVDYQTRLSGFEELEEWQMAWASEPIEQTLYILLALYAIRRLCQNRGCIAPEVERELQLELHRHLSQCGNRLVDARFGHDLLMEASLSRNELIMHAILSYFDPPSLTDRNLLSSAKEAEEIQARPSQRLESEQRVNGRWTSDL
ncbi:hypothetical protein BDV19DRAFT_386228 [Aspergillus venezuelensis]